MALAGVIEGIKTALRGAVPPEKPTPVKEPKDQMGPYPMLVVYPYPGDSTPKQHAGRGGAPVHQNRDQVVVEWHDQPSDVFRFGETVTGIVDAMRLALWRGFRADRFGGQASQLHAIHTDVGQLDWGSDTTFGVRMTVELTHDTEI